MKNQAVYGVSESVGSNLDFYRMFISFDIVPTGDYKDDAQRIYDIINMIIAGRAQIIIGSTPIQVPDLAAEGSDLTGAGCVWSFAIEHGEVFASHYKGEMINPIGVLEDMFESVYINETTTLEYDVNIQFKRMETL